MIAPQRPDLINAQLSHWWHTSIWSRRSTIAALVAGGLSVGAICTSSRDSLFWASAAGLACTAAGACSRQVSWPISRQLRDVHDISTQATNNAWDGLTEYPKAALKDADGEVVAEPEYYPLSSIKVDASGILIIGGTGYGKTSTAVAVAGELTEDEPAEVLCLDPHGNELWEKLGIPVLTEFKAIEQQTGLLVDELDSRRELWIKQRKRKRTLLVFGDELNACLDEFANPKQLSKALRRIGSEGRKFGIIFIGINQSGNVDALDLDSNYRANFLMIAVGSAARELIKGMRLTDDQKAEALKVAYPCAVTGAVSPQLMKHPTHGDYTVFRKVGNPPRNLKPINQLPLSIEMAEGYEHLSSFASRDSLNPHEFSSIHPLNSSVQLNQTIQSLNSWSNEGSSPESELNDSVQEPTFDPLEPTLTPELNRSILSLWQRGITAQKDLVAACFVNSTGNPVSPNGGRNWRAAKTKVRYVLWQAGIKNLPGGIPFGQETDDQLIDTSTGVLKFG